MFARAHKREEIVKAQGPQTKILYQIITCPDIPVQASQVRGILVDF